MGTLADKTITESKGDNALDRQVHHVGEFKPKSVDAVADEAATADEPLPAEGTGEDVGEAEAEDKETSDPS